MGRKFVVLAIIITLLVQSQAINYLECAGDILNLVPYFEALEQDVQSKNVTALVQELGVILGLAPQIEANCGINLNSSDFENTESLGECVSDVQDIVAMWSSISFELQNIEGDLAFLQNIVEALPQTLKDCSFSDTEETESINPEAEMTEFCIFEDPFDGGQGEETD